MPNPRYAPALGVALLITAAIVQPAVADDGAGPGRARGGAVVEVATQDELDAALRALRGGDSILLAPGTYAGIELTPSEVGHDRLRFEETAVIASADPGERAVVNRMVLRGVSNVEIRDLTFDRAPSGTGRDLVSVERARDVAFDDVTLKGHVADGFGTGVGLRVQGSKRVALTDSEVSNFRNGLHVARSEDVTIARNDFTGMSNDSMILGAVDGARIESNHFYNQKSPPELRHKDSIQFHTRNGTSRDIQIRDNRIENPEVSHTIFFGNSMAREGDLEAYYADIVIEDNFIRGAHAHGITIEHGLRVRIEDNTVLQNPDLGYTKPVNVPIINVSSLSEDVVIKGNRVASVPARRNASWDVSANLTAGRKLKHWYGDYPPARGPTPDEPDGEAAAGEEASRIPRPRDREAGSALAN